MPQPSPRSQHKSYITVLAAAVAPLGALSFFGFSQVLPLPSALVLSLVGYAITLALASVLLRHFVLRKTEVLREEIEAFLTRGDLPKVDDDHDPETEAEAARRAFRELAEEQLISQTRLEHAEVLQREVFHRVSNNFQIIQSMIRLIARDKDVIDPLRELEERVQLLSIAHHAHHRLDDVDMRALAAALPALVDGMKAAGFLESTQIELDIARKSLPVQHSYAVLHLAIEGLRTLDQSSAEHARLMFSNGEFAITSDADDATPSFTSTRLATAFAKQLGGRADWSDGGLRVSFEPPR